jgi:hypothetical protein
VVFPDSLHRPDGRTADVLLDQSVAIRSHRLAFFRQEKERGQTDSAQFEGVENLVLVLPTDDNLCAATADVDEYSLLILQVDATGDTQVDQPGFFSP